MYVLLFPTKVPCILNFLENRKKTMKFNKQTKHKERNKIIKTKQKQKKKTEIKPHTHTTQTTNHAPNLYL